MLNGLIDSSTSGTMTVPSPLSVSSFSDSSQASVIKNTNTHPASTVSGFQSPPSSSYANPIVCPNDSPNLLFHSLCHRTVVNGSCLSLLTIPQSQNRPYLVMALARNSHLSSVINKKFFSVDIPKFNLFSETLNSSHIRYQRVSTKNRRELPLRTEPTRNYTHLLIIIPIEKTNAFPDNIIGNSNANVEVSICSRPNVSDIRNTLETAIDWSLNQSLVSMKRALENSCDTPGSISNRPPPKVMCRSTPQQQEGHFNSGPPSSTATSNNFCNTSALFSNGIPQMTSGMDAAISLPSFPYSFVPNMNSSFPISLSAQPVITSVVSQPLSHTIPPPAPPRKPTYRHVRLQINMETRSKTSSNVKSLSTYFLSNIFVCVPAMDNILKHLSLQDRLNCRLVCDTWLRLVDSSKSWRKVYLNTSEVPVGYRLNSHLAGGFFKRCQHLHLDWECNNELGGLPMSDFEEILSFCSNSLQSFWLEILWNPNSSTFQKNDPSKTSVIIQLETVLKTVPTLRRLGISASLSEHCFLNWTATGHSNTSITYLVLNNIHRMPSIMQLVPNNLPSLQTLHLESFHLCKTLNLLKLHHIQELILDCDGFALKMKSFDWLATMTQLIKVTIVNVLYDPNILRLMTGLSKLPTLTTLILAEHLPQLLLSTNELLVNHLPKGLSLFHWEIYVIPAAADHGTNMKPSAAMYVDMHYLRCITQSRFRNPDVEISVNVHDPSSSC